MKKEMKVTIKAKKVDYEFSCEILENTFNDIGSIVISGKYTTELMENKVNEDIGNKISEYINSNELNVSTDIDIKLNVKIVNAYDLNTEVQITPK